MRRLRQVARGGGRSWSRRRRSAPPRSPTSSKKLAKPRAIWLMVPAAVVDKAIADLLPLLEQGDILIDGGNSYYVDDIRRAKELAAKRHPLRRRRHQRRRLGPGARLLHDDRRRERSREAPRPDLQDAGARHGRHPAHAGPREGRRAPRKQGYLHCGPNGARPLRQDGAQRHRVRAHGRLRRRVQHPASTPTSARPTARSTPRRRRCAIPSTTSTT